MFAYQLWQSMSGSLGKTSKKNSKKNDIVQKGGRCQETRTINVVRNAGCAHSRYTQKFSRPIGR